MWGGRSKILAPGKKKENLKKGFQALQKLNASRIIRKEPAPNSEFRGRYRIAQDKNKYKKKREGSIDSDKNSQEEMAAHYKPAAGKDKYKKYRDVIQIKGTSTE